ncbi:MAG: SprT family zinc-dependent metalloprotease [Maricaulaceae bacterium]|jgi:predicted metal-dependent hydrolase
MRRSRRISPPPSAIEHRANPRARRVSLRVDAAKRRVLVTRPARVAKARADAFLVERADWVRARWAELPPPSPFIEGGEILFRGAPHLLERPGSRGRPKVVREDGELILSVPAPEGAFEGRVRRHLRAAAEKTLISRVEIHADALRVPVARVRVKDTATRWGSCAPNGELAFSWRLIGAPPWVLDYVAAHEVAHLRHANHSSRFWSVVRKLYGDPEPARIWLRENAALLFALGAQS